MKKRNLGLTAAVGSYLLWGLLPVTGSSCLPFLLMKYYRTALSGRSSSCS